MTFLAGFLRLLGRYWYYGAAALGAVLLAVFGAAYVRALRPAPGTLEWIGRYDRPALSLAGRWHGLDRRDAVWLPAICLLTAGLWGFAAIRSHAMAFGGAAPTADEVLYGALLYGLAPVTAAASLYGLLRGLMGQPSAAAMGAAVLALDLTADPGAMAVSALALLLLARYLTAPAEAPRWPLLALAFAAAAVGCYFMPELVILAAAALALLLAGCLGRFVELGRGRLWPGLALALGSFAAVSLFCYVPAAVLSGVRPLISAEFYRMVAARLADDFAGLFGLRLWALLPALWYDWPTALLGLCAAVTALVGLIRRRDFRGLLPPVLYGAMAALALLGGIYALPLGAALGLGYVWGLLAERRAYGLLAVGSALPLALLGALYLMSWVLR